MLLAILIFLIVILILSTNIHIYLLSQNDTIKIYVKIWRISFNIPYQKIILKRNKTKRKEKGQKHKKLILNILSRSTIDHIYIAKYTNEKIFTNPISNGLYLLIISIIFGLLHCRSRHVYNKDLRLQYASSYENVDYYLDAHIDIISIIWASIKAIGGR